MYTNRKTGSLNSMTTPFPVKDAPSPHGGRFLKLAQKISQIDFSSLIYPVKRGDHIIKW